MIDSASGNKIKENKYKILRMSLLLGTGDDREETINNFEDAARDIDAMDDEVYLKELEDKFYDTLTLEEEEKKLASLVDYIGGRAQQRVSLINDFANVTGYELSNLPPIKYYDRLDEYKDRLNYIREYLDNTSKINTLSKEVEDLEVSLEKTYSNKEKAEERNSSDEKELLNKFKNIINRNAGLKDIDVDNIDNVLADVSLRASDSKKSLDIFEKSFSTLENAGISHDEEQEYSSYVSDARDIYYKNKEQEYLLTIYKLLIGSESEYSKIIYKRNAINDILYERINLRKELGIKDSDVLEDIYDLLDRQYKNIERQKRRSEAFDEWFIYQERNTIISCLHKINEHVYAANSIYPTCIEELKERRIHQDLAIGQCYRLVQELQYSIETLPVDINVYLRFSEQIQKEVDLIKGWRKSDNKFKKLFEKE